MANELIVIVEDNEQNQKLARDVLQLKGYRVLVANDAETGIPLVQKEKPDLVLMDIHLPGMNGIEALAKLRAAPETKTIPVFAFTASVMPQDRKEITSAGTAASSQADQPEEFLETIATRLKGGKRAAAQGAGGGRRGQRQLLADLLTFEATRWPRTTGERAREARRRAPCRAARHHDAGMNGYEVCRAIADPACAVLPVVMITPPRSDAGAHQAWTRARTISSPSRSTGRAARASEVSAAHQALWDQLSDLNANLEKQVSRRRQLERLGKMKRSSRPRSPDLILSRAARIRSGATAARSPWCSSTCAASPSRTSDPEE
jgi:two-component system cell cycle response regulator DivK